MQELILDHDNKLTFERVCRDVYGVNTFVYAVTYYEYYSGCGWRKIGESEFYDKFTAEYEFGIKLD